MVSRLLARARARGARLGGRSLRRRVSALVQAALPSDAAPDDVAETVRRVVAYVTGLTPPGRALFSALLWQLEICPLEMIGRPARFSRLMVEDRRRVLAAWERSRLYFRRAGAQALKGATLMFYYSIDEVAAHLHGSADEAGGEPC